MKYKIIVDKQSRTNPSAEKREYEIDIEELRCKGDVYDSLVITKDEDYIMRRLSLSEYHVLKVLEEPIKQPLADINIELFEGDNYIYLIDMVGNKFYAEYLIKNQFNDVYITKSEANSAIEQKANQIELSVNEKLTNYSTTEEVKGMLSIEAGNIKAEVSGTYATKASLDNTSKTLSASIELKLNKEELISEINASADSIKLNAGRLIIESGNFQLNSQGNITCTGGKIGGWTIGNNELNNGKVFIRSDGTSTIYTVADLFIIRGYIQGYAGFEFTNSTMKNHYDLNGDGVVDSKDYMRLRNLIGLEI